MSTKFDPTNKIEIVYSLLRLAGDSAAAPEEAQLSATRALQIARKYRVGGQIVAKCRVACHKTKARLERAQGGA